ncbi:MAG: PPOX class F420-dependent oxidoreductase [Chloroflexaceae bacterium]|nr:PPOX class F420-dependent oxidoreductase [Chloroflexaceae bacterium]NJL33057.1 PPOX class F420-dependent oxidoreductase [Chloroflexaceae bacterium]NJO04935.1 PPOX class F420-dependent oxidoreductase [Chloroflexaceae bacterium]
MDEQVRQFLAQHHGAIMVTIKPDSTPHVARIVMNLVDGKLWSSSTATRVRTGYLRRDPRATLCVLDEANPYHWLGLETTVTILDGPDAPQLNLQLYRTLAGDPQDIDEYLQAMIDEQRLIYQFEITRAYGQY